MMASDIPAKLQFDERFPVSVEVVAVTPLSQAWQLALSEANQRFRPIHQRLNGVDGAGETEDYAINSELKTLTTRSHAGRLRFTYTFDFWASREAEE